jgi:hypothetical protein
MFYPSAERNIVMKLTRSVVTENHPLLAPNVHGWVTLDEKYFVTTEHRYSPYHTKTHYVSTTKPNRLMLFEETVAVYCVTRTYHSNLCRRFCSTSHGQWSSQSFRETAKQPTCNLLLSTFTHSIECVFTQSADVVWRKVAVYCENHTEHTNTLCGQNAEF